eukprot:434401-Hanusia_phi.AAC.1
MIPASLYGSLRDPAAAEPRPGLRPSQRQSGQTAAVLGPARLIRILGAGPAGDRRVNKLTPSSASPSEPEPQWR